MPEIGLKFEAQGKLNLLKKLVYCQSKLCTTVKFILDIGEYRCSKDLINFKNFLWTSYSLLVVSKLL